VLNDPVNFVDPNGQWAVLIGIAVGITAGLVTKCVTEQPIEPTDAISPAIPAPGLATGGDATMLALDPENAFNSVKAWFGLNRQGNGNLGNRWNNEQFKEIDKDIQDPSGVNRRQPTPTPIPTPTPTPTPIPTPTPVRLR
jgi:hypothetical protein